MAKLTKPCKTLKRHTGTATQDCVEIVRCGRSQDRSRLRIGADANRQEGIRDHVRFETCLAGSERLEARTKNEREPRPELGVLAGHAILASPSRTGAGTANSRAHVRAAVRVGGVAPRKGHHLERRDNPHHNI